MLTAFSYLGLIVTLFSCSEAIREIVADDKRRWIQRGSVLRPGKANGMLLDPRSQEDTFETWRRIHE